MDLKSLPTSTVRLIGSSQVITSVYSVVKELLENALDAQSTSIDIKLENYGLDKVEVRDNGTGIKESSIPLVAKRYHTSKILSFADLEQLVTYGFRGEALGSLCAVSDLSVISKTTEEEVSHCVTFDHHGNIVSTVPSHLGQGTTVCATHLFKNLPVRRQFYNTVKKKKEELKRVEDLLMWYGAIRPDVRLLLKHGKDVVWQKNTVPDVRAALFGILGRSVVSQLQYNTGKCDDSEISMEVYLPKPSSDVHVTSRSTPDRCFIVVNRRPVFLKDIDKVIRHHYCQHHTCESRYPIYYLAIDCPSSQLDVNLDPNKTRIMLHNQTEIITKLTEILEELYGPIIKTTPSNTRSEGSLATVNGLHKADNDFERNVDKENLNALEKTSYTCIKEPIGNFLDNQKTSVTKQSAEEENCRLDENVLVQVMDRNPSNNSLTGLRISFYDSDMTGSDEAGNLQTDTCKSLDFNSNKTVMAATKSDVNISRERSDQTETPMECDLVLTQGAKGNFDLVDDDVDCLLVSQANVTLDHVVENSTVKDNGVDPVLERTEQSSTEEINLVNLDEFNKNEEPVLIKEKIQPEAMNTMNSNEINSENQISVDKLPATDPAVWSRGQRERQTDGQTLEPVKLLVPDLAGSKRPPSPTAEKDFQALTPPAKKRIPEIQVDQPRIYDCVGNSGSDKYTAGFVAFSKQMRSKVVEDNPAADYDTITKLVQEKWAKLSDTNKQHFCLVGKDELEVLKKSVLEKKKLSQKIQRKHVVQVKAGLPSIKDQLLASSKIKVKTSPQIKTVRTPFSLENLKHLFGRGIRESQTQLAHSLHLIGPLKFYNGWACYHGNKLLLLNPHRVEETLLYRELLDKHNVPLSSLENPIRLTGSNLGESLYHTLLTLFPTHTLSQTYTTADDERLVANGIQVRMHQNQDCEPVLDLVGLSQVMPLYGVSDLVEILDLICNTKATSLSMARPLKVINYLQSEAVRMVRQRPLQRSHDDMVDLLEQMTSSLPDDMTHCLHDKPFLHDLYDLKTVFNQSSG